MDLEDYIKNKKNLISNELNILINNELELLNVNEKGKIFFKAYLMACSSENDYTIFLKIINDYAYEYNCGLGFSYASDYNKNLDKSFPDLLRFQ